MTASTETECHIVLLNAAIRFQICWAKKGDDPRTPLHDIEHIFLPWLLIIELLNIMKNTHICCFQELHNFKSSGMVLWTVWEVDVIHNLRWLKELREKILNKIFSDIQWNLPEWPPLLSGYLTKILIGSSVWVKLLLLKLPILKQPPPISDHLSLIKGGHALMGGSTVVNKNCENFTKLSWFIEARPWSLIDLAQCVLVGFRICHAVSLSSPNSTFIASLITKKQISHDVGVIKIYMNCDLHCRQN